MNRRSWRYLLLLLTLWLLILGYMGWHLFVLVEDSNKTQATLDRRERHVELLKAQNQKFKQLLSDLQAQKYNLEELVNSKEKRLQFLKLLGQKKDQVYIEAKEELLRTKRTEKPPPKPAAEKQLSSPRIPSLEHENLRRKVDNEARELHYYLSAEITKINKKASPTVKKQLRHMLTLSETLHGMLTNDLQKLSLMDGASKLRWDEHVDLSNLVQKRLKTLQNPKDCSTAKKLVCQLNKGCGYGCQIHHVFYCFIVAYGLKRTLIIESTGWRYSSKGWEGVFAPPSDTCVTYSGHLGNWDEKNREQNILLPIVDSLFPRPPYMPQVVPEDISKRLSRLHGHPFIWWIGQFAKYLLQYNPDVQKEINKKRERMGFRSPIVGIQVRRTDKINTEAAFHSVEEYMYWVKHYYHKLELRQFVDKKRVFVASDDDSVLPELQKKYQDFEFISDVSISKSAALGSRYSDESLHGVIFDIQMLSECDFLVCTFSSQVCRVGYEMMQARHPDASKYFQSLDDIYYFGGQSGHNVKAIMPHTSDTPEEIDLEVGDLIGIAGNHWDGYSKGTNHRSGQVGLFPSWKVEEVMETAEFPTYE